MFIVRVWMEPREETHSKGIWRGVVEEMASHDRIFFNNLDSLLLFIQKKTGIDPEATLE